MVPPLDWPPLSLSLSFPVSRYSPLLHLKAVILSGTESTAQSLNARMRAAGDIQGNTVAWVDRLEGNQSRGGRQRVQESENFRRNPRRSLWEKFRQRQRRGGEEERRVPPLLLRCPISLVSTFCPLKKTAAHVPFPLPRDSCLVSPLSLRVCCGLRLRKKRPGK